jgi:hypothetical protein
MFSSISDFVSYCKDAPFSTKNNYMTSRKSSISGSLKFTETKNYEEAENLLLNGWDSGAEKLNKSLKLANKADKQVQKAIYDIVGFLPSVPRYLQGIPTNMINKKTVKVKQKVVTLVKDVDYLANISAKKIMDDSVKFLQIVQAIEAQGIRVNIEIFLLAQNGNEMIHVRIPVKKSSERLNISKLSFPLMHPSMLRRFLFRVMEKEQRVNTSWNGYGDKAFKGATDKLLKPNEYYIPTLINQYQMEGILNDATK